MRIISGTARGTKLYSLEGISTRPTLDRIKESLFNIINAKIADSIVLDLFAGSGALGIECASRGAKEVVFCDKSKEAINILNKNLDKTRLKEKSIIVNLDYNECLEKQEKIYDLIFIDPPYKTNFVKEAICRIIQLDRIKRDGLILVETDEEELVLENLKDISEIEIIDIRKYGRVKLIFIERKG